MKKTIALLVAIFLTLTVLALAACGGSSSAPAASDNTVHMGGTTFAVSSISISKGSTITFTTDSSAGASHNLVNGSDGHAVPETGVPDFGTGGKIVAVGSSWTTAAWNTAGTFHVTCTYHPTTMTLTVTVS